MSRAKGPVPSRVRLRLDDGRTTSFRLCGVRQSVAEDPRVARLLSHGWWVEAVHYWKGWSSVGRPAPKEDVDVVHESSSRSSSESHGGDEATGDIAESPNATPDGLKLSEAGADPERQPASRGRRSSRRRPASSPMPADRDAVPQPGGRGGWVPALPSFNAEARRAAKRAGERLAEIAGRAAERTPVGVTVDPVKLAIALELGDDPRPALEAPRLRPKARALITDDESGSTQAWSHVGRAFAECLAAQPDVVATYRPNFNGDLIGRDGEELSDKDSDRLVAAHDVVVYLGDGDGEQAWERWASLGATVVALDSFRASWAQPRVVRNLVTRAGGQVIRIDQVSASVPDTWVKALHLAFRGVQ